MRCRVNYRSTHALVQAVNHSFLQAEARPPQQGQPGGAFQFAASDGSNPLPFVQVACPRAPGSAAKAMVRRIARLADVVVRRTGDNDSRAPVSSDALRQHMAAACAEQIVQWLSDAHVGFAQTGQPLQRLRPRDMAVLVRTGKEATAVRQQLQRRGVASVYLSDQDSVFASAEAQDLQLWLRAVAAPLEGAVACARRTGHAHDGPEPG